MTNTKMRLVALDTETTGMNRSHNGEVSDGHRIIEIGCVEILDGAITNRRFHKYIKPGRAKIDPKATEIHGISRASLKGKPSFKQIVKELLEFIDGATLIIHNAPFDISFLDKEFKLLDKSLQPNGVKFIVIDTLLIAREMFPGYSNTLDSLSKYFDIGLSRNGKHGALLDAEILARIYIMMERLHSMPTTSSSSSVSARFG